MLQDWARHGAVVLPGIALAIASCIAYISMKGVMMPEVSAGSNQMGASETCEPMVSWPSGAAAAVLVLAASAPSAARRNISRRVTGAVLFPELGSSWSRRDGCIRSLPPPLVLAGLDCADVLTALLDRHVLMQCEAGI